MVRKELLRRLVARYGIRFAALQLGCSKAELRTCMNGVASVPDWMFLKALDLTLVR